MTRFTFTEVPIAESTTEFPSSSGDDVVDGEDARHFHLSTKKQVLMRTMQLKVIVEDPTLNKLFTLIMTLLIIFTTINMGGQLDLEIIKEVEGNSVVLSAMGTSVKVNLVKQVKQSFRKS